MNFSARCREMVRSEVPISKADDEVLEMVVCDISRANFRAPMDREACSQLQEDLLPEDGDVVGILW